MRQSDSLPPVSLTLSEEGSQLVARLQLSGRDSRGTATLEGSRLRLRLAGPGASEIEGEVVSETELRLQLRAHGTAYALRRVSPR